MAIPTEDRRGNLRIRLFGTSAEAVEKPRLNTSAPTCFVALNTRTYAMLKAIGEESGNDENMSP